MTSLKALRRDRSGQGLAEYAIIIAIVAIGVIAAMTLYRNQIGGLFRTTENAVAAATTPDDGNAAPDPGSGDKPGRGPPGGGPPGKKTP